MGPTIEISTMVDTGDNNNENDIGSNNRGADARVYHLRHFAATKSHSDFSELSGASLATMRLLHIP